MKKITLKEALKIKKELENYKKELEKKGYYDIRNFIPILKKYGFSEEILGTGTSASTCSCAIDIMDIKSRKYLDGKFLVIGMANMGGRKGVYYRGYVLEIKD